MEGPTFPERFGHRVRRRRQVKGLTQKAVADAIRMPPSNYSRLEKGEYQSIQLVQLYQLAQVLETTTDYLMTLSDDQGAIPPDLCPGKGHAVESPSPSLTTTTSQGDCSRAEYTNQPYP
jgi:transcriptional regulator with XRE-family HTH domain